MNWKSFAAIGAAFLLAGLFQTARADEWNQQTFVTFNHPVEIPGQVLPAGTYVFKLADSQSNRDIVQVFNKDQDQIYATVQAIPDYRLEPTGKTVITFQERKAGAPEAVKTWFYPGALYGVDFVYPNMSNRMELAQNTAPSSAPTTTAQPEQPTVQPEQPMSQAPATAQPNTETNNEQNQIAQATPPQTPETNPQPEATQPSTNNETTANQNTTPSQPSKMPATGSELPLVGLIGLLLIGTGTAFGLVARRVS